MILNTFKKLTGSAKKFNLSVIHITMRFKKFSLYLYEPCIIKRGREEFKVFPCCHSKEERDQQLILSPHKLINFRL